MLGTHNSMTYLKAQKWYMRPFQFVARCQRVDIEKQYHLGARIFDIRIYFDSKNRPMFKHGLMKYKGDVDSIFKFINSKSCIVRLILEQDRKDADRTAVFKRFCKKLIKEYPYINFTGGYRKYDWKKVYDFSEMQIIQLVSSMTGSKADDWCPLIYARTHNKKNLATHNKWEENIIIDFIDII